jgi:hypothetical protein
LPVQSDKFIELAFEWPVQLRDQTWIIPLFVVIERLESKIGSVRIK